MKILYVTSLSGKRINSFMESAIIAAKYLGFDFTIVSNMNLSDKEEYKKDCERYGIIAKHIDFERAPWNIRNLRAKKQLFHLMKNEHYDVVHCNTPIGGVIGRICAHNAKIPHVIYQAHGFHFCKTTPKKNWLMFYPVEWLLAHWTDVLITINEEDYALAKKHMHAKRVEYVPGVGIDLNKFSPNKMNEEEKSAKRESLGLNDTDKVFLSVGEINKDKNHILMIRALQQLRNNNFKYIICGVGELMEEYEKYIQENNLDNCVKFLGYRSDISEILQIADVFVFPSTFEGLPVALMEAIASKVMVICSASRGNTDLVKDKRCLFDYRSVDELIQAIHNVENMTEAERNAIIEDNYSRLLPREKSAAIERMKEIYKETEAM